MRLVIDKQVVNEIKSQKYFYGKGSNEKSREISRFRQTPAEFGGAQAQGHGEGAAGQDGERLAVWPQQHTQNRTAKGGAGVKMLGENIRLFHAADIAQQSAAHAREYAQQ